MTLGKNKISVNKSCTAKTFREKGIDYAIKLADMNLDNLYKVLQWNYENGIRFYRMSSDMFPHITNPEFIKVGEYSYPLSIFKEKLEKIGEYAKHTGQRLTFHPSQFNQVGSPHIDVFNKTCKDLKFHADVLDIMKCGVDSVIVVHGGGTYGDKETTKKRWCEQFNKLPENVRSRLVIENCERQYSVLDVLDIATTINIPVVFDVHHHRCWEEIYKTKIPIKTFIVKVLKTWKKRGIKPKFHISEQAPSKRIGAHSDYVEVIPKYLFLIADRIDIDIMIEAKCKELAVLKLEEKYKRYIKNPKCNVNVDPNKRSADCLS